jgi:peroxiredoxin
MVLLNSLPLPLGTPIIPFSLPDPEGKMRSHTDYADRQVLVVIFMCNHCPYIKAIQERLIALQENYNSSEVQLIGINANDWENYPDDSPEMMKQTINDWGINFPYLYDESQETAKAYQAQCTPDIFVFDKDRKLAYHGRVDDNWQEPKKITKEELKEAIDSLLAGEKPSEDQHHSIGCSIKWKE